MPLLIIAISYLILGTLSNAATLYYSYSGPNYLLAFGGIFVKLLEYYIVFAIAKRHLSANIFILFKVYWGFLIATAAINLLVQGQLNYVINTITLLFYLLLMGSLIAAPAGGKLLKSYAAFKIVWILYSASLFVKALMATNSDASTIIIILALSFMCDALLVAVAWWSHKTTLTTQEEKN